MSRHARSAESPSISRAESVSTIDRVAVGPGVGLGEEELGDYCKRRGLCPLCAKTRTRKRVIRLFKKNEWELLTVQNDDGEYLVYKGYCVKPTCFTLSQARRLAGEKSQPEQRRPTPTRQRSFVRRLSSGDLTDGETTPAQGHPRSPHAFPPPELRNTTNFEHEEGEPQFVVKQTVHALQMGNDITILDLSGFSLQDVDFECLAKGLRASTTLVELIMENCRMDDARVATLAASLDEAKDIPLSKFYLRNNNITFDEVDALCLFLESSVTLEKLDLSRNKISSQGAVRIFHAFSRNRLTRIRCINLSHNNLWDLDDDEHGIKPFLLSNRSLILLNLEGNHINDESVKALADGVAQNDQCVLKRLYLGWNYVGDEGAAALGQMLETNTTIRILGLGENQIQNNGGRALLAALDNNTTVTDIPGLWRNKIRRTFIIVAIRRLLSAAQQNGDLSASQPTENEDRWRNGGPRKGRSSGRLGNTPQQDAYLDTSFSNGTGKLSPVKEPLSEENGIEEEVGKGLLNGESAIEEEQINGLTLFQAAPLTYVDREAGVPRAIPLLDFAHERSVIKEALHTTGGPEIRVHKETATLDHFSKLFADKSCRCMHYSCYGHHDSLALENGYGSLQAYSADGLHRLFTAVDSNLRLVFIFSRHSRSIGKAFVEAGVPHVVCCQVDDHFRDVVAIDFVYHFYRSLASYHSLAEAFKYAADTVTASSQAIHLRCVLERFHLLPERSSDDPYHDVPIFSKTSAIAQHKVENDFTTTGLPRMPLHFMGREVEMYEILEALRVHDVLRVTSPRGHGKDTVVAAVCNYALERQSTYSVDGVFWLPAPNGLVTDPESLYGDLCLLVDTLISSTADVDVWESEEMLDCRARIEIALEDLQAVFVLDDRRCLHDQAREGMENFINFILEVANTKVLVLTERTYDPRTSISQMSHVTVGPRAEEASIDIEPLSFKSTAKLFGATCNYIASSGCPAAHSASEFADLLEPTFIAKLADSSSVFSDRRGRLFGLMGKGLPASVIESAENISKRDFIDLIGIANRPEVFVDSLGALENEIARRTRQRDNAIRERNFLRAEDLDSILDELESMRPEFFTIEEMEDEEEILKLDFEEAVANRQYDVANDLKRELVALRKKIIKERELMPNHVEATIAQMGELQSMIHAMIEGAGADNGATDDETVTFAVNCDNRDCYFIVKCGDVCDFEHNAKAIGIVCWSNEACELKDTVVGGNLLEYGGTGLALDISSLPTVTESRYGIVRCGTGNAVVVGPDDYDRLSVPMVILSVGPLTPSNHADAHDDDTDSLPYIRNMLRSCYRSSMVLAKHSELHALAITPLTTRETGDAYEQTLRVGLQTLAEEAKFSHLQELHIFASSPREVSIISTMLKDMGHQEY